MKKNKMIVGASVKQIGLFASAGVFDKKALAKAIRVFVSKYQFVVFYKEISFWKRFAGSVAERKIQFQNAINDINNQLVLAVRGGYGTIHFSGQVNWNGFMKKPTWVMGFSDVTLLLIEICNLKFPCIHGPMALSMMNERNKKSFNLALEFIQSGQLKYQFKTSIFSTKGVFKGKIVGGNLTVIASTIGTPSQLITKNKFLFIEDINEDYYKVERVLNQLKNAGLFNNIKGIILGQFTDCVDTSDLYEMPFEELVRQVIDNPKLPMIVGWPSGHEKINYPIILNWLCEINVEEKWTSVHFV